MKRVSFLLLFVLFFGAGINAQTHPMRVGAQVGLALPMGDLSDAYSAGFSFNGLFIYRLQNQFDLTGSIGYMTFGSKEDEIDASFSTVPVLFGARYSFAGASAFTPYIGAELGLFFSSSEVEFDFGFDDFDFGSRTISDSSTDFGLVPQAGFTYAVSPMLTLDANVKFNLIMADESSTIFGVNVGLTYGL